MNQQQLLIGMVLIIFLYAWYSANKLHDRIRVFYKRVDRALIEKDVKLGSKTVTFYNHEYKVLPDRIGNMEWKRGIHAILPIWRHYLILNWDDEYPEDPSSYKPKIISPEVRNVINQEKTMASYAKSQQSTITGKKLTGLAQYIPMITLGAVIILAFVVYTMNQHINLIEQLSKVGR